MKRVLPLSIVLGVLFLIFGIGKFFAPASNATAVFGQIGGTTAQYFTGVYQIIAGILIMISSLAFIGAFLIALSMFVAILLHIFVLGFQGAFIFLFILAIILLVLSIKVMARTRNELLR